MEKKKFRVLIADDERIIAHNIAKNVERADEDFQVVSIVTDGELALEQAAALLPHLVITDIKMPVMDGLELMRRLSHSHPDIRVMVVSGYDDFELVRTALQQNAFDYLLKPINLEELRSALSKIKSIFCAQQESLSASNDPAQIAYSLKCYLQDHMRTDVNLSAIASDMGFSASYLTKVFKEHNDGQTPVKYLSELRMVTAKQLLLDTDLSVKEIGEQVGYSDPFHFSKAFKQLVGVSPAQYRGGSRLGG